MSQGSTRGIPIDTDTLLVANSDQVVPSQKAVKTYVDSVSAGSITSLTGEVTGTGPGATAATIANGAVTYAKMQNVTATDRILGRDTIGAGVVEELTASAILDMIDSTPKGTMLVRGTTAWEGLSPGTSPYVLTSNGTADIPVWAINRPGDGDLGDITVSGSGATWTIDNGAVTYAKMQDVSATDRLLGRDTALAGDVEELTVGGGIEFTGTGGIQTSAFTGDVTKAAAGTALTIANDAVTYAKMQNTAAASKLLGRGSLSGAGDLEEITVGSGLTMTGTTISASAGGGNVTGDDTSTTAQNIVAYTGTGGLNITELTGTQGDVLYHNGTSWVKLGAGTNGFALKTGGASANPAWGAAWTLVRKTTSEARASNTTLTNDGALLMTLAATTKYVIRMVAYFTTANATMDYKFATNYTGSVTGTVYTVRRYIAAGAAAGTDNENVLPTTGQLGSTAVAVTTTGTARVEIEQVIETNTSGTWSFQWAQNTSDAGNLTCLFGSYVEYVSL